MYFDNIIHFYCSAFINLFDNYEKQTNVKEDRTLMEIKEEQRFSNLVLSSRVGSEVYSILKRNRIVNSFKEFKKRFNELWFKPYFRSSKQR